MRPLLPLLAVAVLLSGGGVAHAEVPATVADRFDRTFFAATDPTAVAADLVDAINDSRADHGLPPVRATVAPTRLAQGWADQMAATGVQSHRPAGQFSSVGGWTSWGENVWGRSQPSVAALHAGFLQSPGHRANILAGRFDEVGVGVTVDPDDGRWWVCVNFFDRTRSGTPVPATPRVAAQVGRVAGDDRVRTAVALSRQGWPDGATTAVLATAADWPDALSGAALAGAHDAPLLLTTPDRLPYAVADELDRLDVDRLFVLGGGAAVSDRVVRQLAVDGRTVDRVAGPDRFATAAAVADRVAEQVPVHDVLVASGDNWPDAVAAAGRAAAGPAPLLLTATDRLPAPTRRWLQERRPAVTVVGGPAVVPDAVVRTIPAAGLVRAAGPDRFTTSAVVSQVVTDASTVFAASTPTQPLWLASGGSWADALAAGPAAARAGAALLLVDGGQLGWDSATMSALAASRAVTSSVTIVGGPAAVSEQVRSAVARRLR